MSFTEIQDTRRKVTLFGKTNVISHIIIGTEIQRPIVQNKFIIRRHLCGILGTKPRTGSPIMSGQEYQKKGEVSFKNKGTIY